VPELPDIVVYLDALERRTVGRTLTRTELHSPFVLRSVDPPLVTLSGAVVSGVERIGKRIVLAFERDVYCVLHLMVAGRLRWADADPQGGDANRSIGGDGGSAGDAKATLGAGRIGVSRIALASLHFDNGRLMLTEAAKKKRASLHVVSGRAALQQFDRGGLDVFRISSAEFAVRLRSESHTLKRALTDPRMLDGIGNAYSDEILHRARLSPLALTSRLDDNAFSRMHEAAREVLAQWTARLRAETGAGWPGKVTAFRDGMAVHGRFRQPCPVCGSPVQRIRYADNETNYCPACQTEGRLLADRALSRLLRSDWPRSLDEYDGMISAAREG
jgi:formamidopyrimidine-DNA glycosylase